MVVQSQLKDSGLARDGSGQVCVSSNTVGGSTHLAAGKPNGVEKKPVVL
jgi:hypothetical protein